MHAPGGCAASLQILCKWTIDIAADELLFAWSDPPLNQHDSHCPRRLQCMCSIAAPLSYSSPELQICMTLIRTDITCCASHSQVQRDQRQLIMHLAGPTQRLSYEQAQAHLVALTQFVTQGVCVPFTCERIRNVETSLPSRPWNYAGVDRRASVTRARMVNPQPFKRQWRIHNLVLLRHPMTPCVWVLFHQRSCLYAISFYATTVLQDASTAQGGQHQRHCWRRSKFIA